MESKHEFSIAHMPGMPGFPELSISPSSKETSISEMTEHFKGLDFSGFEPNSLILGEGHSGKEILVLKENETSQQVINQLLSACKTAIQSGKATLEKNEQKIIFQNPEGSTFIFDFVKLGPASFESISIST